MMQSAPGTLSGSCSSTPQPSCWTFSFRHCHSALVGKHPQVCMRVHVYLQELWFQGSRILQYAILLEGVDHEFTTVF